MTVITSDPGSFLAHYERHLGSVDRRFADDQEVHDIAVVSFKDRPERGVTTYATLGLSGCPLLMSAQTGLVRQELLVSANEAFEQEDVALFLLDLAVHVWRRDRALRCGEVVGPHIPVIPGSTLSAVYATNPSPFPDELWVVDAEPSPVVLAYIIPLSIAEADMLRTHGRDWFEERLERQNPDIWDLARTDEVHHE